MPIMRANNAYAILNGQLLQPLDMRILDALYRSTTPMYGPAVSVEIAKDKDGPVPTAQVCSRLIDHDHLGLVKSEVVTTDGNPGMVYELTSAVREVLDEEAAAKRATVEDANT